MTTKSAFRVRQTSTAAILSCTPSKGIDKRRSLPRTAKVLAGVGGYHSQLMSPEKCQDRRRTLATATPATKISRKMAAVLTFESPESDENRRSNLRANLLKRSTARRLNLSSRLHKTAHRKEEIDRMDAGNEENVPLARDTIGLQAPVRASKLLVPSAVLNPTYTTPLRMKIVKNAQSAKVAAFSVRRREPASNSLAKTPITSRILSSSDAKLLQIVVRFRPVVLRADGNVEKRTVKSGSAWAVKQSTARLVSPKIRGNCFSRETRACKLPFEAGKLESSPSKDYSPSESDETESVSSRSELEISKSHVKMKSQVRQRMNPITITATFPKKKRGKGLQNPGMKVETLEDFRRQLNTTEVPERMLCREEEAAEVERFIRNSIAAHGTSSAMYISGVPGTGKTATVMSVVKHLSRDKTANKFCFVAVNAMEFIDPRKIFVEIYNQITGETCRISPSTARTKLNIMFEMTDECRPPIIILIDELDQLCTKKQELIYDIFNWTSVESARVSVMAIANTLDLPERMLSQRITSRIGAARICFQPYEFQEIERIIHDRLEGSTIVIDEGAVQIAARKVAAVTGDLRKATDLLRRAIEISIEKGAKKLLVEHVLCAVREASSTLLVHFIKRLSMHSFLLFKAAVSLAAKAEDFSFAELYTQYASFAALIEGIAPLVESTLLSVFGRLCSTRLLVSSSGNNILRRRVRLGTSYQDALSAIKIRDSEKQENN